MRLMGLPLRLTANAQPSATPRRLSVRTLKLMANVKPGIGT